MKSLSWARLRKKSFKFIFLNFLESKLSNIRHKSKLHTRKSNPTACFDEKRYLAIYFLLNMRNEIQWISFLMFSDRKLSVSVSAEISISVCISVSVSFNLSVSAEICYTCYNPLLTGKIFFFYLEQNKKNIFF